MSREIKDRVSDIAEKVTSEWWNTSYPSHQHAKVALRKFVVAAIQEYCNIKDSPEPTPKELLCLICAYVKEWGVLDAQTGIAVCVECRDKARADYPEECFYKGCHKPRLPSESFCDEHIPISRRDYKP